MRAGYLITALTILSEVRGLQVDFLYSFIVKGESYSITYFPADDNTTIELLRGPPENIITVATLSTTATRGAFQWTPSDSLPYANNYAIRVAQGIVSNYTLQFGITDKASVFANASITPILSSATSLPPPTSSSTAESRISASSDKLSTGAIAGIGVGAAMASLVLAIVAFFVGRTLHRKSKPAATKNEPWTISGKPELDSRSLYRATPPGELDAKREVRELHSDGVIGEVEANSSWGEKPALQELHGQSCQVAIDSKPVV